MEYMKSSLLSVLFLFFVIRCAASPLEITTTKLPNGTADDAYTTVITAQGGCAPYKWAVESGKLPAGVKHKASANTQNLDLSGTPTVAGSYSFTITVTGCAGGVAQQSFNVKIQNAPENVVSLSWDASKSKNIAGYNIYRGANATSLAQINVSLVPATDYNDSTVSNGNTYYYAVATVNIEGEESSKTAAVKITVPE
jgi:hypothetical protein